MSHAPCTLFWPRSGLIPQPGLPSLPETSARFDNAITPSVPVECSTTPKQYTMGARLALAYSSAAAIKSHASMSQISATRSGV